MPPCEGAHTQRFEPLLEYEVPSPLASTAQAVIEV